MAVMTEAALAKLDGGPTTRDHWRTMLVTGMGFFTDAYDLFIIGVVASLAGPEWHAASYQISLLSSLALLTSAVGALAAGKIADRLGRQAIYGYEMLVLAAGSLASAFAPGIWWLIGMRAVLGLGIGGDYPVSATMMSEHACRRDRGRMIALVFSMQAAGLIAGPLVAIILLSAGLSPDHTWRIMLAVGAIPALAVYRLRRKVGETPRFLLAREQPAERVTRLRDVLADRRLARWLAGATLAWLLFDFVYYGNTISTRIVITLADPHASLRTTTVYTLAIFVVAALPGYVLAAATIDRIGRRKMQATGFAVIAAGFAALWVVPGATRYLAAFLPLYGVTYFFAEFGPNTTTFVYPAEIFPVRVRATCHGAAAAAGKLGAFAGAYALPSLLPVIGLSRVSGLVAGIAVLGLIVTVTLLPEPKGTSLEDLSAGPAARPPGR